MSDDELTAADICTRHIDKLDKHMTDNRFPDGLAGARRNGGAMNPDSLTSWRRRRRYHRTSWRIR